MSAAILLNLIPLYIVFRMQMHVNDLKKGE